MRTCMFRALFMPKSVSGPRTSLGGLPELLLAHNWWGAPFTKKAHSLVLEYARYLGLSPPLGQLQFLATRMIVEFTDEGKSCN